MGPIARAVSEVVQLRSATDDVWPYSVLQGRLREACCETSNADLIDFLHMRRANLRGLSMRSPRQRRMLGTAGLGLGER